MIKVLEIDRTHKVSKDGFSQCEDCGLIERDEWLDNHVCGRITDKKFVVNQALTLKVGKRRFIKLKVK